MCSPHVRQFVMAMILFALCTTPVRSELQVAAPSIDLGVVRGGQKLTQRFELVNRGREAMEIVDIKRGCGCLATRTDQRIVPAGGKAVVSVELRTLGQADGPHVWPMEVHYRAGGEIKTLALSVRGTVQSEITVQPAILGLHVTKQVEQTIVLTDRRTKPLRVIDADARAPGVQVMKIERNGKTTNILVTAEGGKLPAGRHEGVLTITTDDADYGQLTIPVVVTKGAASAVRCVPEQIEVRLMRGSGSAIVRLRGSGDPPVRVARIEPSDPSWTCTWAPGPGNDATLRVQARAGGPRQGHVTVHFAAPADESMVIPVIVRSDE